MSVSRNPDTHVGIAVKIGGVEIPCDPESTDPGILSGLRVTWGRSHRLERPAASTCDLEIVDPDGGADYTSVVQYGSSVEVLAVAPNGTRSRVFGGQVSDLVLTHEDGTDAVLKVTAMDPTVKLSAVMVGEDPWPAQTPQARRTTILGTVPSGTLNWPTLPSSVTNGTVPQARLDVDNQSLWDVVSDFLWGIALVPWPIAYGSELTGGLIQTEGAPDGQKPARDTRANQRIPYAQFETVTPGYYVPTVVVDACDVDLEGTEFSANPADISQTKRITWGGSQDESEGGTGVQVFRSTSGALGDNSRTFDVTSYVPSAGYAQNVSAKWSFHMAEWYQYFTAPWGVGALRLDPDTVTEMDNFHTAMVRLLEQTTRPNHVVMLQDLPTWAPWRDKTNGAPEPHVFGYLQGGVYEYTDGRWVLELNISAECALIGNLAPPLAVTVKPGDVVPYPHDSDSVVFTASPSTTWAPGQVATFTDGPYGWDGDEWVIAGTRTLVVRPGDTVTLAHDDVRVSPSPTTTWGPYDYATFSDGVWTWTATSGWVEYSAPVTVRPGDVVNVPHDALNVTPDPTTRWTGAQYATFSDGAYRWTGTAWESVVVVRPGDVKTFSHLYSRMVPDPTTAWGGDDYATFSDGTFAWDGTAWVFYLVPITVRPGDVVAVAHDTPGVTPEPTTAWSATQYATFSDGPYRWDGTAWVAVTVVQPYDTVTVAHTAPGVIPKPTNATGWNVPGSSARYYAPAWFSDGAWSWRGTFWQAVTVVEPGITSSQLPALPTTTPWPYTAWAADQYATLGGARYRWSGTIWVAWVPSWAAAPEGVAWNDVPAGTSWTEWTGDI